MTVPEAAEGRAHFAALAARVARLTPAQRIDAHHTVMRARPLFDVELTDRCQLTCAYCPRGALTRPHGAMDAGTAAQLAAWLPEHASVMLGGLGEPTLHPLLVEIVRDLAAPTGRKVGLTTNGRRLASEDVDALIRAGLHMLQVSVHAPPEDPDGSALLATLEPAIVRAREGGLLVSLTVVRRAGAEALVHLTESAAQRLGVDLFARHQHSRAGGLGSTTSTWGLRSLGCGIFARVGFVTWRGDVLACCNDLAGRTALGSIHEHTFDTIQERKAALVAQGHWFPICDRCDDSYRFELLLDPALHGGAE
jgi:hypothetical protein